MTNPFQSFDYVVTDKTTRLSYRSGGKMPLAVGLVETTEQIAKLVRRANELKIPVITRGRSTGLTDATYSLENALVISTEKMNKIIQINHQDRYCVAQSGVLNQQIQDAVEPFGLFFAADPSSKKACSIGGNIACNAGGPQAIKYGAVRENVLGLTVITGDGQIIKTGSKTSKGATGYDLTRLFIGSEGTLGVVSEVIVKLKPLPKEMIDYQVLFNNQESAIDFVTKMMESSLTPHALEFLDKHCLAVLKQFSKVSFDNSSEALIMIRLSGFDIQEQSIILQKILEESEASWKKATSDKSTDLWRLRSELSPALRHIAPKRLNEDVVVPVSRLSELFHCIDDLAKDFDLKIVNFGHIGNGNIHTNIMYDPKNQQEIDNAHKCLDKVFRKVVELEGLLSGEHGIGLTKKEYTKLNLAPHNLVLMRQIKKAFDPNNLFNPHILF